MIDQGNCVVFDMERFRTQVAKQGSGASCQGAVGNEELLAELERLRKENRELREKLAAWERLVAML